MSRWRGLIVAGNELRTDVQQKHALLIGGDRSSPFYRDRDVYFSHSGRGRFSAGEAQVPIRSLLLHKGGSAWIEFAFICCSMSRLALDRKLNPGALRHSALQTKKTGAVDYPEVSSAPAYSLTSLSPAASCPLSSRPTKSTQLIIGLACELA